MGRVEVAAGRVEVAARRADALARSLCAARERVTPPLARLAFSLCRERAWNVFGFARASDFAREHFDRSGRWLRDLAALHAALVALPALGAALTGDDGGPPLGRVRALLVGRIATPGSLPAWVARARRLTVRALREAVAAARGEAGAMGGATGATGGVAGADDGGVAAAEDPTAGEDAAGRGDAVGSDVDDPDPESDRVLVRLAAPAPIVAAFDEAVDLFRAVEGSEATVVSFVEALVGEASAGDGAAAASGAAGASRAAHPESPVEGGVLRDVHRAALLRGPRPAIVEEALARSTGRWGHLPRGNDASWGLALGRATLARLAALAGEADTGSPAGRVARMRALLSIESEIESRLGRVLAAMGEDRAWLRLRFADLGHYAEERLGLSRTTARSRAHAARLLGRFPRLRAAYERKGIGLEAALIVGRVLSAPGAAGPSLERAWVRHALDLTVKRLRDEARALARCGAAGAAGAVASLAAGGGRTPAPMTDGAWQASLRRGAGTSPRRVAALGWAALGGGAGDSFASSTSAGSTSAAPFPPATAPFSPATARLPRSDVFLRLRLPDDLADGFVAAVTSATARCAARAEAIPWDADSGTAEARLHDATPVASTAARMFSIACRRVPPWVGLMALLEDFVATWDPDERRRDALDDAVFVREGWRCAAPACTSRRNLEDHHVLYRSRGGGDGMANRVCLCRFHHQRGEHGGLAQCRGSAPLGLTWRLGARDVGRWYRNERRLPLRVGAIGADDA